MTFQEMVEYEAANPGTIFLRIDYATQWGLQFLPGEGKLVQGPVYYDNTGSPTIPRHRPIELYHHDFAVGQWEVALPKTKQRDPQAAEA